MIFYSPSCPSKPLTYFSSAEHKLFRRTLVTEQHWPHCILSYFLKYLHLCSEEHLVSLYHHPLSHLEHYLSTYFKWPLLMHLNMFCYIFLWFNEFVDVTVCLLYKRTGWGTLETFVPQGPPSSLSQPSKKCNILAATKFRRIAHNGTRSCVGKNSTWSSERVGGDSKTNRKDRERTIWVAHEHSICAFLTRHLLWPSGTPKVLSGRLNRCYAVLTVTCQLGWLSLPLSGLCRAFSLTLDYKLIKGQTQTG